MIDHVINHKIGTGDVCLCGLGFEYGQCSYIYLFELKPNIKFCGAWPGDPYHVFRTKPEEALESIKCDKCSELARLYYDSHCI